MALHLAQGSWIFVGSIPCAAGPDDGAIAFGGGGRGRGGGGAGRVRDFGAEEGAMGGGRDFEGRGEGIEGLELMSSGGSIWGRWHLGQLNSMTPGATVRISWQQAQRT